MPSNPDRSKIIPALHRKAYSRESKLKAIEDFRAQERLAGTLDDDGNVRPRPTKYSIGKKHGITATMLRKWLDNEETIRNMTVGQRKNAGARKAKYPLMEEKLTDAFVALRAEGNKVKRMWFIAEAQKISLELYPETTDSPVGDAGGDGDGTKPDAFKFSSGWFRRYKKRHRISSRAPTP